MTGRDLWLLCATASPLDRYVKDWKFYIPSKPIATISDQGVLLKRREAAVVPGRCRATVHKHIAAALGPIKLTADALQHQYPEATQDRHRLHPEYQWTRGHHLWLAALVPSPMPPVSLHGLDSNGEMRESTIKGSTCSLWQLLRYRPCVSASINQHDDITQTSATTSFHTNVLGRGWESASGLNIQSCPECNVTDYLPSYFVSRIISPNVG